MRIRTGAALALALWGSAVQAGITARYASPLGSRPLIVETGDAGDFRIGFEGDDSRLLRSEGRDYLIVAEDGEVQIVPLADLAAVLLRTPLSDTALRDFDKDLDPADRRTLKAVPTGVSRAGTRSVAGQAGIAYRVGYTIDGQPHAETVIASQAEAMRPLADAWRRAGEAFAVVVGAPPFRRAYPGLDRLSVLIAQITGQGALLDAPMLATLRTIRLDATPTEDRFDLPGPPLGQAELEDMIRTAGDR
ncbi:MAG: hypothetical protein PGN09_09725 [Sphingomonas fennica]